MLDFYLRHTPKASSIRANADRLQTCVKRKTAKKTSETKIKLLREIPARQKEHEFSEKQLRCRQNIISRKVCGKRVPRALVTGETQNGY